LFFIEMPIGACDFISDFCLSTRVADVASVGELWSDKMTCAERQTVVYSKCMKRLKPGFSILELLIVLVIVGILAAVAIYSLGITRASNRDAKRISDVSVIHASITQYWLQQATYPSSAPIDLGKPGAGADKLTSSGFVAADSNSQPIYLSQIPTAPNAGEYYRYHGSANGYSLKFTTERPTAYGIAGTYFMHAGGVDKDDSEK
jgi:prepilin-type N-terminal cleavage/methylation domain-containing protein